MPLDSALSRLWKVVALANRGEFAAAVVEARAAERLAPQSVDVQFVLGRALNAAGRQDDSRQVFEKALRFARTIHPEAQSYWIPVIETEMERR
jgi:Flp pilus assembly protein TadD